jgi:excinuclease ABC subunit B
MYADQVTDSMRHAVSETNRRRKKQPTTTRARIDPQTIRKKVTDILEMVRLRTRTIRTGSAAPRSEPAASAVFADMRSVPPRSSVA